MPKTEYPIISAKGEVLGRAFGKMTIDPSMLSGAGQDQLHLAKEGIKQTLNLPRPLEPVCVINSIVNNSSVGHDGGIGSSSSPSTFLATPEP